MAKAEQTEKVYTWEVMEIGHDAPPISMEITKEFIAISMIVMPVCIDCEVYLTTSQRPYS